MNWVKNGEGFNQRKAESAGVLNFVKVAEEVLQREKLRVKLELRNFSDNAKLATKILLKCP